MSVEENAGEPWPRAMKRKTGARYMDLSLRKFDEIKHLFRVVINGVVRYDRELMDLHISLARLAA